MRKFRGKERLASIEKHSCDPSDVETRIEDLQSFQIL